jgi:ABC-type sugar transport system substrate-binding protein
MMMRRTLFAVALAAVMALAAPEARADHKGKIPWVTDPTQGFAQARREGKPIMIFFTADW